MITKAKSGEQRHFDHPVQEFVICLVNKLRIERVKNSYEKFINIWVKQWKTGLTAKASRRVLVEWKKSRLIILTYLLTYSMVQSPSWEANWFAASQEIPHISQNPKVHYRTHKRPPPVSILGQPNPVHISTSHLLYIHPNIIHPSTARFPHWSPSLRFPQQGLIILAVWHRKRSRNLKKEI